MRVLLAADGFVTAEVMSEALERELPEAEMTSITSQWPDEPFLDIADVKEAYGDEDELIAALQGCEVAVTHTYPFTEKVFAACPDLKLVTVCRGGPVNANLEAATKAGVVVTFTPGRNAVATAEHTVAMILAATRQIVQRHIEVVSGEWRSDYYKFESVGPEIGSSRVGVVGYGAVGSRVAATMAAMGASVLVFDPWATRESLPANVEFLDSLDELLSQADILTLHARVTTENHHMINAETLAKMPRGSFLVNCARGSLVDYDAVCEAIDSGQLYAAAFDCLPEEPLPAGHRLFSTPRITMTPHLGGASKEAARLAARIGAADIAAFSRGGQPKHVANPEALEN